LAKKKALEGIGHPRLRKKAEQEFMKTYSEYYAVQLYAEGSVYNNVAQTLFTLVKPAGEPLMYGAMINFPGGIKISNFPKLESLEFLPPLGKGTYFSYCNIEDGTRKMLKASSPSHPL
jgi:hypothetical protein